MCKWSLPPFEKIRYRGCNLQTWFYEGFLTESVLTFLLNCFLKEIFSLLAFQPTCIGWILNLLFSCKVGVNVNGENEVWIFCRHGLRHEDPLSSFLFILAVDPLCRLLNSTVSAKIFEGLETHGSVVAPKFYNMRMIYRSFLNWKRRIVLF